MFERTFSFWRRLVGHEPAAASGAAPTSAQDDRRLWVRYPADLKTSVGMTSAHTELLKTPAKIRDISRGGANLILEREVQPGQLVNLELPLSDGDLTLPACAVRAEQEPSGRWALGCVFSRELSDEDLERFGAQRLRHAPEDQRTWMRFPTTLTAAFEQVEGDRTRFSAGLLNLSASGVGLLVDRFVDAGALLNVELGAKDGGAARTILACVVHVTERDPGQWALGCNFIRELSEDDLNALV